MEQDDGVTEVESLCMKCGENVFFNPQQRERERERGLRSLCV